MPENKLRKLYPESELASDYNYISTKEAVRYFPWLRQESSHRIVQSYVQQGYLLGRCLNPSPSLSPHKNQWQVFVPDIERFKKTRIKKI